MIFPAVGRILSFCRRIPVRASVLAALAALSWLSDPMAAAQDIEARSLPPLVSFENRYPNSSYGLHAHRLTLSNLSASRRHQVEIAVGITYMGDLSRKRLTLQPGESRIVTIHRPAPLSMYHYGAQDQVKITVSGRELENPPTVSRLEWPSPHRHFTEDDLAKHYASRFLDKDSAYTDGLQWQDISALQEIFVTRACYSQLSQELREQLRRFVASGGVIHTDMAAGEFPAADGFGAIYTWPEAHLATLKTGVWPENSGLRQALRGGIPAKSPGLRIPQPAGGLESAVEHVAQRLLSEDTLKAALDIRPVSLWAFFWLAFVYFILAGPLLVWRLHVHNRRIWLTWLGPCISLVFCLAMAAIGIFHAGFGVRQATGGITVLDQDRREAASIGLSCYYAPQGLSGPLSFSAGRVAGLMPDEGALKSGNNPGRGNFSLEQTDGLVFATAFVPAKSLTRFFQRCVETRRERLEFVFLDNGALEVANHLGVPAKNLLVRVPDGRCFGLDELAPGETATATALPSAQGIEENFAKPLRERFAAAAQNGRSAYLAQLSGYPFIESGIPGRSKHHYARSELLGLFTVQTTPASKR